MLAPTQHCNCPQSLDHALSRLGTPRPTNENKKTPLRPFLRRYLLMLADCTLPTRSGCRHPSRSRPDAGDTCGGVRPSRSNDNGRWVPVLPLQIRGRNGPRVLLRAGHKTTVVLHYDPSYAGLTVDATALDAGDISFPGGRNFVGAGGTVVLQLQWRQEPGLYRIMLNCGGIVSTLRFWVPDPAQPGVDPSVIVPPPLPSATPAPAQ